MNSVAPIGRAEVNDNRRTPRFIVDPPISGTFDGAPVQIYNLGEHGLQFEHKEKLQRFHYGEIRFSLPISPRVIRLGGHVAWCRLAKKPGVLEAWPYRCGLRVEALNAITVDTLAALLRTNSVRPDKHSLERKKRLLAQRQAEQNVTPFATTPELPPPLTLDECITRVQSTRRLLEREPALYAAALAAGKRAWRDAPADDEIIAVWQQLARSVDPALISMTFDLYPE